MEKIIKMVWIPKKFIFKNQKLNDLFQDCIENSTLEESIAASCLYNLGMKNKNGTFFQIASDFGHANAQEMMFTHYFKSNEEKAVNYLKRSAAQGCSSALLSLSSIYLGYSLTLEKNLEIAKLLCESAKDLKNVEAQFRCLVSRFTEGTFGSKKNFRRGIKNAINLKNEGNEYAINYFASLRKTSRETLLEMDITLKDLKFLKSMDLWNDEDEI